MSSTRSCVAALAIALAAGCREAPPPPGQVSASQVVSAPTKVESKTGLEFVLLPGGSFHYGCDWFDQGCTGEGHTEAVEALWIGETNVTVQAYLKCMAAGVCSRPHPGASKESSWNVSGAEKHSINGLNWQQAKAFCEWIGARLPTGIEWEYAAKGGETRPYPWSGEPPNGATKYGLRDLVGNVGQWTSSKYVFSEAAILVYQHAASGPEFSGLDYRGLHKEVRGGGSEKTLTHLLATERGGLPPTLSGEGVRCARSTTTAAAPVESAKQVVLLRLDLTRTHGKVGAADEAFIEEALRDATRNALRPTGWTVATGQTTSQMLEDSGVETTKCADQSWDLSIARMLKVGKFLSGVVEQVDGVMSTSVRLTDAETGSILATQQLDGADPGSLRKQFEGVAPAFFSRGGLIRGGPQPMSGPHAGDEKIEPRSGLAFTYLPGGRFFYGCEVGDSSCQENEQYGREVSLPAMWMGKTEVTVEAYAKCVQSGGCRKVRTGGACNWGVSGKEQHPANCVQWKQANTFCEWIGGRLPTSPEWEYAAKSGESHIYAWGNDPLTGRRANFCDKQCRARKDHFDHCGEKSDCTPLAAEDDGWPETAPVGSYPEGATKYGLLDMIGNVLEWTASSDTDLYDSCSSVGTAYKDLRGGSWWNEGAINLRNTHRVSAGETAVGTVAMGFRCSR